MDWNLRRIFTFEGQSVAYDRFGAGPPLVLVHGTPFSSFVWRAIARELARHFEIYLYDLIGYGQSEKREGQDVSLGMQNRLLAALLQFWSLEQPDVIAHDFGGATVLRAHLLDGCEYKRLLLIDPVAVRPWGSPFVRHVRQYEEAFAGIPDYIQEAILTAYLQGAAFRPLSAAARQAYAAPWTGPVGKPAFYRQIAQMDQRYTDEIQDHYPNLRCPSRLLWGVEDGWIPVERGRELAALLPGCRLTEIPDCGHLMQEDAPEAIVAAALGFFG
ncbi:alpha/beta fold hydrolase [Labrys okinawensis]|uniref:alpha/beta fold hydrolase n=1 Tax=Labrys okinawensis TaxID=346911 RepID=UPI0039BD0700